MGYKSKPLVQRVCPNCSKEFRTNRKNKIYCKEKCRNDAWIKLHPRVNVTDV